MTAFRDRPEFPLLVAAVRAGDGAAVAALWDLLEDCQATTADVMTLYAAPPPAPCPACGGEGRDFARRYFGEPAKYPTCDRCRGSGVTPPAEDDSLRPVLACWAERHGPPGRGAVVRSYNVWQFPYPFNPPQLAGRWSVLCGQHMYDPHFATEAAARRELKRRVLGLFDDVRVPCPACGGRGRWATVTLGGSDLGVMACVPCGYAGTVAPADLIPPEPFATRLESLTVTVPPELRGHAAEIVAEITRGIRAVRSYSDDHLLGLPVVLPPDAPPGVTAMSLRRRAMTRGVRRYSHGAVGTRFGGRRPSPASQAREPGRGIPGGAGRPIRPTHTDQYQTPFEG